MSKHEERSWSSWVFLGQSDFKQGLLGVSDGKNIPAMQETQVQSTPLVLPREFHGQGAFQATVHGVTKRWTRDSPVTPVVILPDNVKFYLSPVLPGKNKD